MRLAAAFVLCLMLFPAFRHPLRWWDALVEAGRGAAVLMCVVAAIGFVIGVVNMTGIGLMFAEQVLAFSGSSLALSLVMVMWPAWSSGMGVPTGAAYLIIAIVLGPAIEALGVPADRGASFRAVFRRDELGHAAGGAVGLRRGADCRRRADGDRLGRGAAVGCRLHHPLRLRLPPRHPADRRQASPSSA